MENQLEILYQDDVLVAVRKPPNLLVHRSALSNDTVFALQTVRDQLGKFVYPVHRLDRATSGVLLFALDSASAHAIIEQFLEHSIAKTYQAIVRGWTPESGEIDYAIADEGEARKSAVTKFRLLAQSEIPIPTGKHPTSRYSLCEAYPLTGRRHQIRKHFAHIFHPIIGDVRYGDGKHNRLFREEFGVQRLLLFAQTITLRHPQTQGILTIHCPADAEWAMLTEKLFGEKKLG